MLDTELCGKMMNLDTQFTGNQSDGCAGTAQRTREGQTAPDVPQTNGGRCIRPQSDAQGTGTHSELKFLRTEIPAACRACFAPAGVCSVKWNMLAAATADAPACSTTSIMWW